MTQSEFADYVGLAPATLSSIFNGRTRPTLNVVEVLKKKIPNINMEWLMFGEGEMYQGAPTPSEGESEASQQGANLRYQVQNPMLDFDQSPISTAHLNGVRNTRLNLIQEEVKNLDKPQRRVLEIRVFYDDQTWETFVPSRK